MRTLITLSVLAAGLLAFILLFERGTVSDGDMARRQGRVLQRFFRDRISELTVDIAGQAEGQTLRLLRHPEQGELAMGTWYVDQPFVAEADQGAVDALLGELEWMDARRQLSGVSEQDRKRFGLDRPAYRVTFKVGRDHGELSVGDESPKGDGFYVQADGDGPVYIVGRDLIDVLDHAPEHYHSKTLHDGLMALTTHKLVVRMDGQTFRVERRKGQPWMTSPSEGAANADALERLVDTLDALQATRFVRSTVDPDRETRFGLAAPFLDIDLVKRTLRPDASQRSGDARYDFVPVRFRVGAPCADHEGERYLWLGETGPVMCVAEADLSPVREAATQLRETRLAAVQPRDVTLIVLEEDGAKLSLRRDGSGFVAEYIPIGGETTTQPTQAQSVSEWLDGLAELQAIAIDVVPVAAAHPDGDRTLRVEADGKVVLRLSLRKERDRVLVLREGEPAWSAFPSAAWDWTAVQPNAFRQRQLLNYPADSLRSLVLTHEKGQQRLQIPGDAAQARVTLAAEFPADADGVRELSRRLAALQARRFVQSPTVSSPESFAVVEMEFRTAEGVRKHRLRLSPEAMGSAEDAEHLSQLEDGDGWFTLSADVATRLLSPWIARNLPSIPLEALTALRIDGATSCSVLREGGGFELAQGAGNAEHAQRLAEAWATVEASTLEFAAPPRRHWTVVQESANAEPREFWFESDERSDRLFLDGLEVAFVLPEGQRAALLRCPPRP